MKQHRGQCLILGRRANVTLYRQRGEELLDFQLTHLCRMPLAVEQNEPFDRLRVSGLVLQCHKTTKAAWIAALQGAP